MKPALLVFWRDEAVNAKRSQRFVGTLRFENSVLHFRSNDPARTEQLVAEYVAAKQVVTVPECPSCGFAMTYTGSAFVCLEDNSKNPLCKHAGCGHVEPIGA